MPVPDFDFVGITHAKAGYLIWNRAHGETESAFLARCRAEAAAAKHEFIYCTGHIRVAPPCPAVPLFAPETRSSHVPE